MTKEVKEECLRILNEFSILKDKSFVPMDGVKTLMQLAYIEGQRAGMTATYADCTKILQETVDGHLKKVR